MNYVESIPVEGAPSAEGLGLIGLLGRSRCKEVSLNSQHR